MAARKPKSEKRVEIRMLFAEDGSYHAEVLSLPAAGLGDYVRLIDFLMEDESVLREAYIDVGRLCAAQVLEGKEAD